MTDKRAEVLLGLGFNRMEDFFIDELFEEEFEAKYRGWDIYLACPNGGIIGVDIISPEREMFSCVTEFDGLDWSFGYHDYEGIMGWAKRGIDAVIEPGPLEILMAQSDLEENKEKSEEQTMNQINTEYAVTTEAGTQSYPAIQATEYKPRSVSETVRLCLSQESLEMLGDNAGLFAQEPVTCHYGEQELTMFLLPEGTRFVALGLPRIYILDKETGKISVPEPGEKLAGTKRVTATRVPMAMQMPDGSLVVEDDQPQIFTLKLTSSKTVLVNGDTYDQNYWSLRHLKEALGKQHKVRNASLLHLVSVGIVAQPRKFSSRGNGDSSIGVMFNLSGDAKPLSETAQKQVFELVQGEEVLGLLDDPFGIKQVQSNGPDRQWLCREIERMGIQVLKFPPQSISNQIYEMFPPCRTRQELTTEQLQQLLDFFKGIHSRSQAA